MRMPFINNFTIAHTHLGKSVLAARPFRKGNIITEFTGPLMHKFKVPKKYIGKLDRYIQVDREYFLGPSKHIDDLINHSCNPNAGLKFTEYGILLVALKNINVGEEINWDYSTTILKDSWKMNCLCGEKKCRKLIGDFKLLPRKTQEKYRNLNIIPPYIKDYMNNRI